MAGVAAAHSSGAGAGAGMVEVESKHRSKGQAMLARNSDFIEMDYLVCSE